MSSLPPALIELIAALRRLPGVGPRSAERLALHLVQSEQAQVRTLAEALVRAATEVKLCERCGGLTQQQPCSLCADPRRDHAILCVVERPVDILSIEKAGGYRGGYHVLGGRISPTNGVGPEDLRVAELEQRLAEGKVAEVVVALPTDVEGDATAFFLAKRLAPRGVKITRLAHGLPAGSSLDFADDLTLSRAIEGRRPFL
jgi:recombination protein RecR